MGAMSTNDTKSIFAMLNWLVELQAKHARYQYGNGYFHIMNTLEVVQELIEYRVLTPTYSINGHTETLSGFGCSTRLNRFYIDGSKQAVFKSQKQKQKWISNFLMIVIYVLQAEISVKKRAAK